MTPDATPAIRRPRPGREPGNRIWRVETDRGPVLQKVYRERGNRFSTGLRAALSGILRGKSSPRAAARRRTERDLLRLWREAGFDVPADRSDEFPDLAGGNRLVMEYVPGRVLGWKLIENEMSRAERDALLARFAGDWARRHRKALATGDPRLIQTHGTFMHVLFTDDRQVTIDLEQTYRPDVVLPRVLAREIEAYLRSLAKCGDEDLLRRDLRVVVDAYGDPAPLRMAVDEYLHPRGPARLLWRLDRWKRTDNRRSLGKYRALELLEEELDARGDGDGDMRRPAPTGASAGA